MTIEKMQVFWFLSFTIDLILGCMSFYILTKRMIVHKYEGLAWYMGWWAFVDAFAIALNATMGTDYFWSYHQTGIISDTAINLGLIIYVGYKMYDNWALNGDDWSKIEQIQKQAKIRELSK